VADLANWDRSLNNILSGESGQILSRHYKDQWDEYYSARSFPMQFNKVEAKQTLSVRPE
jgi:acyl-homoserine lactone acylase PvdQ